jgi:hypothetical protein
MATGDKARRRNWLERKHIAFQARDGHCKRQKVDNQV